MYAKFACMQKLENLHLPETKCKFYLGICKPRSCVQGFIEAMQCAHLNLQPNFPSTSQLLIPLSTFDTLIQLHMISNSFINGPYNIH